MSLSFIVILFFCDLKSDLNSLLKGISNLGNLNTKHILNKYTPSRSLLPGHSAHVATRPTGSARETLNAVTNVPEASVQGAVNNY